MGTCFSSVPTHLEEMTFLNKTRAEFPSLPNKIQALKNTLAPFDFKTNQNFLQNCVCYKLDSNSYYLGEWNNYLQEGRGIELQRLDNGNWMYYEGFQEKGHKSGQGRLISEDGDYQEGGINDVPQGDGIFCKSDKSKQEGNFVGFGQKQLSGQGKQIIPEKGEQAGQFINGVEHGTGMLVLANGCTFHGEFRWGVILNGTMKWKDGSAYIGGFIDNKFEGEGKYFFPNGDIFEGKQKGGEKCGEGCIKQMDGSSIAGIWTNGNLHGKALCVKNGEQLEVDFVNGTAIASKKLTPIPLVNSVFITLPGDSKLKVSEGKIASKI